jgi:transglutaminase-like putative cysteine protease
MVGHGLPSSQDGTGEVTERRSSIDAVQHGAARQFVLSEHIRYRYSAPVTNLHQRLKVIPPSRHGRQRRRGWRLTVEGASSSRTRTGLDRFGNFTIEVAVPRVDDTVAFRLEVDVATETFDPPDLASFGAIDPRHTRLTAPSDLVAEVASSADGGDVAALCAKVHGSLEYQWGVTGVRTTAAEALAGGRGVCQDYAHIMLAACHLIGLPARYVSGHLAGEGGSHAWVEVFERHPSRPDAWTPQGWDPTHNRPTDDDYLVVAVGRDYADVAPLTGSYDGVGVTNVLDVDKRLELA